MSDLDHCPKCGGPADNGHDRCIPPNVYWCTKCMTEYFGPDAPKPPVCAHCTHPMYAGIRCGSCGRWTDEKEEKMISREQVMEWAKEAELHCHVKLTEHGLIIEDLQYFANLVAAAEREACAKLVFQTQESDDEYVSLRETIALAIRARGEK